MTPIDIFCNSFGKNHLCILMHVGENGGGRVGVKALICYAVLPKQMRGILLDVDVCRGEGGGMSDHFFL